MVAAILRGAAVRWGITGTVAVLEDVGSGGETMRVHAGPMLGARQFAHLVASADARPLQGSHRHRSRTSRRFTGLRDRTHVFGAHSNALQTPGQCRSSAGLTLPGNGRAGIHRGSDAAAPVPDACRARACDVRGIVGRRAAESRRMRRTDPTAHHLSARNCAEERCYDVAAPEGLRVASNACGSSTASRSARQRQRHRPATLCERPP